MIPAPLLALVRYLVVYACARLAAQGWTIANLDPDTMTAIVNVVAGVIVAFGMYAATVGRAVARLVARHHAALLDGAASVPGVTRIEATPQLAAATASPAVVAGAPQPGAAA